MAAEHLPTVASLSRVIGSEILTLVETGGSDERTVSGSAIYDPNGQPLPFPGAIALCIGLSLSGKRLRSQLQELADASYAALVYKASGADDQRLREMTATIGLALFRASDSVPWNQLAEIIDSAIAPHRASGRSLVDVRPGDLFDLANTVASLAGGAIAIADPEQTILAYSTLPDQPIDDTRRNSILQLHVPRTNQNDQDYRRVHAAADAIDVATGKNSLARSAIAIRAGDMVLGSLWLLRGPGVESADSDRVLREAANIAALHLLHRRTTYVSNLTHQIDLVKPFLFESDRAEVSAIRLGIATDTVRIAALAMCPIEESVSETLQSRLRLFDVVRTACAVRLPTTVCGFGDNIVYIVMPQTPQSTSHLDRDALLRIVHNTGRQLRRPILAGLGRVASIAAPEQSRTDAEEVLAELLREADAGRANLGSDEVVADRETLGSRLYLRQIVVALQSAGHVPGDHVTRIADYDASHHTSFEETIRSYLSHAGNAIEVAKQLGLHVNTVRYRLSRVESLFGIDLNDPDTRLLVWIQLWANHN